MDHRFGHHLLTALLLVPTVIVVICLCVSPWRTGLRRPVPQPLPVTSWEISIIGRTVFIERVGPVVPFTTTLPTFSPQGAGISPPGYGTHLITQSQFGPRGMIETGQGDYLIYHQRRPRQYWSVSLIPLLFASFPLAWVAISRMRASGLREQRRRAAYCVECGYDLRASPERCPECGVAVEPRP